MFDEQGYLDWAAIGLPKEVELEEILRSMKLRKDTTSSCIDIIAQRGCFSSPSPDEASHDHINGYSTPSPWIQYLRGKSIRKVFNMLLEHLHTHMDSRLDEALMDLLFHRTSDATEELALFQEIYRVAFLPLGSSSSPVMESVTLAVIRLLFLIILPKFDHIRFQPGSFYSVLSYLPMQPKVAGSGVIKAWEERPVNPCIRAAVVDELMSAFILISHNPDLVSLPARDDMHFYTAGELSCREFLAYVNRLCSAIMENDISSITSLCEEYAIPAYHVAVSLFPLLLNVDSIHSHVSLPLTDLLLLDPDAFLRLPETSETFVVATVLSNRLQDPLLTPLSSHLCKHVKSSLMLYAASLITPRLYLGPTRLSSYFLAEMAFLLDPVPSLLGAYTLKDYEERYDIETVPVLKQLRRLTEGTSKPEPALLHLSIVTAFFQRFLVVVDEGRGRGQRQGIGDNDEVFDDMLDAEVYPPVALQDGTTVPTQMEVLLDEIFRIIIEGMEIDNIQQLAYQPLRPHLILGKLLGLFTHIVPKKVKTISETDRPHWTNADFMLGELIPSRLGTIISWLSRITALPKNQVTPLSLVSVVALLEPLLDQLSKLSIQYCTEVFRPSSASISIRPDLISRPCDILICLPTLLHCLIPDGVFTNERIISISLGLYFSPTYDQLVEYTDLVDVEVLCTNLLHMTSVLLQTYVREAQSPKRASLLKHCRALMIAVYLSCYIHTLLCYRATVELRGRRISPTPSQGAFFMRMAYGTHCKASTLYATLMHIPLQVGRQKDSMEGSCKNIDTFLETVRTLLVPTKAIHDKIVALKMELLSYSDSEPGMKHSSHGVDSIVIPLKGSTLPFCLQIPEAMREASQKGLENPDAIIDLPIACFGISFLKVFHLIIHDNLPLDSTRVTKEEEMKELEKALLMANNALKSLYRRFYLPYQEAFESQKERGEKGKVGLSVPTSYYFQGRYTLFMLVAVLLLDSLEIQAQLKTKIPKGLSRSLAELCSSKSIIVQILSSSLESLALSEFPPSCLEKSPVLRDLCRSPSALVPTRLLCHSIGLGAITMKAKEKDYMPLYALLTRVKTSKESAAIITLLTELFSTSKSKQGIPILSSSSSYKAVYGSLVPMHTPSFAPYSPTIVKQLLTPYNTDKTHHRRKTTEIHADPTS
ncbi:hypothetical protein GMRT_11057 [Giardia muris]|uniref:Uncharacterized protein n=1 Tax=Giardia muris TaxID=5742 RepID=A0A4Z1SN40_GIAMU|nr:hypothetical protein GMRT_11057 [Giardia muris]|eukprot:TNJ27154.1 hypothetical protein GMRT_11057 [Giardia muris]